MSSSNVVGVVAEYNPLHAGHEYQLREARSRCDARASVVVLSGDFVQRGEPAMLNKWDRARTALAAGADLVLELPSVYSSHNAGVFANAAIDILRATNAITHISFGIESPDMQTRKLIDILVEEPKPFKVSLKEHLDKGYSYVEARALALDFLVKGAAEFLRGPNNSLALAYMLRVRRTGWNAEIIPVARKGSDYNDKELGEYSSSAALRSAFANGREDEALASMPQASADITAKALRDGDAFTKKDKLWDILRPILLRAKPEELASYAEISEGIEYRLREAALECGGFDEWVTSCASRRYPRSRIQRSAMHILLGLGHWTNRAFQRLGPSYIRVLAMNGTGRELMREIKSSASLPTVTRCGDAAKISSYAEEMMRFDVLSSELRAQMLPNPKPGAEHRQKIIIQA